MFNLNTFSTRVKKSLLYDNISKSKTEYYSTHNIYVNKKSMTLLLDGILSKDINFKVDDILSIKHIDLNSKFSNCNFTKEEINYKKSIKEYKDYKVLFFRQTLESSMVLSQLHFYNGKLIYANSSFTYLGENENFKKLLILKLSNKYNLGLKDDIYKDIYLEDIDNNRLMIIDNGRIVLHYVSGDKDLLNNFRNESGMEIGRDLLDQELLSIIADII